MEEYSVLVRIDLQACKKDEKTGELVPHKINHIYRKFTYECESPEVALNIFKNKYEEVLPNGLIINNNAPAK